MMENRILEQFSANLRAKNIDDSFLENDAYDFNQKFSLYRSARVGLNLEGIANPDISSIEMDEIIDEQLDNIKNARRELQINVEDYNYNQIYELTSAIQKGYDVTQYMKPEFSAEQMYLASTFQQEQLMGLEQVKPDMSVSALINLRQEMREEKQKIDTVLKTTDSVLEYYTKIDSTTINTIKQTGYLEVSGVNGGISYLNDKEPHKLAELLGKVTGHEIVTPKLGQESVNSHQREI